MINVQELQNSRYIQTFSIAGMMTGKEKLKYSKKSFPPSHHFVNHTDCIRTEPGSPEIEPGM
jgi:hypothetical protein